MSTTQPRKPIGVGIIGASPGYSWASIAHIPALQTLPDFKLVAVSTTRQETAVETAKRFGVPNAFNHHEPLIAHPDVDLVVVAVRAPSHAPLVRAALSAKKDVLCEWPVGGTALDTVELAKLATEQGVRTVVGLQRRLAPGVRHLRSLIERGYIGKLRSVNFVGSVARLGERRPRALDYTAKIESGINALHLHTAHFLDVALAAVGEEPASFSALVARQFDETIIEETGEKIAVTAPDQVAVAGTLRSGAVFLSRMESGKRNGGDMSWVFTGTEGDLMLNADLVLFGAQGDNQPLQPIELAADPAWPTKGELSDYAFQTAHVYAGYAHNSPLTPSFQDAARLRRMLEAFASASVSGQRCDWPPT